MFKLEDASGTTIKMKNGKPFLYSTKALAQQGKRILEGERKIALVVRAA